MQPTTVQQLLTIQQVQAATTLSKNTIYRLIHAGKFPAPVRIGVQRVAWKVNEVAAFIDEGVKVK